MRSRIRRGLESVGPLGTTPAPRTRPPRSSRDHRIPASTARMDLQCVGVGRDPTRRAPVPRRVMTASSPPSTCGGGAPTCTPCPAAGSLRLHHRPKGSEACPGGTTAMLIRRGPPPPPPHSYRHRRPLLATAPTTLRQSAQQYHQPLLRMLLLFVTPTASRPAAPIPTPAIRPKLTPKPSEKATRC